MHAACCVQGTIFCVLGGFSPFLSVYSCIYRTKLREQYGIEGNRCKDCIASCLCPRISICQEYRELQARGFDVSAGNSPFFLIIIDKMSYSHELFFVKNVLFFITRMYFFC